MNATSIISKVQKLLNTAADSAATPSESATALAIAQRLMLTHRISEQQIREHARAEAFEAGGPRVRVDDLKTGELGLWQLAADSWLAMAAAEFCGCRAYRHWTTRPVKRNGFVFAKSVKGLVAYGLPADLAVARELFLGLLAQSRSGRKTYCAERGVKQNTRSGRSWIDGFAVAILSKVREARAEQRKSKETVEVQTTAASPGVAPVMALVCVGDYERELENALVVKAKQLGIGKGRSRSTRSDYHAQAHGAAAGSRVKLSRDVLR